MFQMFDPHRCDALEYHLILCIFVHFGHHPRFAIEMFLTETLYKFGGLVNGQQIRHPLQHQTLFKTLAGICGATFSPESIEKS